MLLSDIRVTKGAIMRIDTMHETAATSPIAEWCIQTEADLVARGIGGEGWEALGRAEKYALLEAVTGNTPLEAVPELPNVYTKLEYTNPSGSHYDRASLATLKLFEERGYIQPRGKTKKITDVTLYDITSGSGGDALALGGLLLNYPIRICVPDELPDNRVYPMEYFGAEIVRTGPGYIQATSDFQRAEIEAHKQDPNWTRTFIDDPDCKALLFEHNNGQRIAYLNHSENSVAPQAHGKLAREIMRDMETPPEAIVLAIGNWTTIAGVAEIFRHEMPGTKIIGVKPDEETDQTNYGMVMPGLQIPFRFQDAGLLDKVITVSDEQREEMRVRINDQREDITRQLGNSSLVCLVAAEQAATETGGKVVTIAYDQAMRY